MDDLKKTIRDAGLRSTGSRIGVLRLLHEAETPLTHGEVSDRVKALGFDHATIYRNLNDFAEAGIATRTDLGDHAWRFELQRGAGEHQQQHPHFRCTDCGVVACLPEGTLSFRATSGVPQALRKGAMSVQIQGVCDACQP